MQELEEVQGRIGGREVVGKGWRKNKRKNEGRKIWGKGCKNNLPEYGKTMKMRCWI